MSFRALVVVCGCSPAQICKTRQTSPGRRRASVAMAVATQASLRRRLTSSDLILGLRPL